MPDNQLVEILLEKAQKKFTALTGEDTSNVLFIVPQVIQNMCDHGAGIATSQGKIMGSFGIQALGKNMAE